VEYRCRLDLKAFGADSQGESGAAGPRWSCGQEDEAVRLGGVMGVGLEL